MLTFVSIMKFLGIIPSRYGSTRFPGKPLVDIQGKSMIQRVYEQAQKTQVFSSVIVATDDQRIFDHVEAFGGQVKMTSPAHTCGTDRCIEVLESEGQNAYDVVVNIQGDEPVIDPQQLIQLCRAFDDVSTHIATLVKKTDSKDILTDPSKIKVVRALDGNALYFSRQAIPHLISGSSAAFYKHIGIYAFRAETLLKIKSLGPTPLEKSESLEQLRWLEHGLRIQTVETEIESISVDEPKDLDRVLTILNGR